MSLIDQAPTALTPRAAASVLSGPAPDPEAAPFAFDVAVVGLGYVGLPTALALHETGLRVVGVDINEARLDAIVAGEADLLDADRIRLAAALLAPDSFLLTGSAARISDAAAILVCVPTPVDEHQVPDLGPLAGACASVVSRTRAGQTLLLTSTTYVGCTRDLLVTPLAQRGLTAGRDVFVGFAPERIDPGHAEHAQQIVPRVVGAATVECLRRASAVLAGCSARLHPVSSLEAAELTKLYENTFRAVNISLANEFASISAAMDLSITEVIDAAATKPYGFMPFYPGPGVGGHCIPCDPHYLLWQLRASRTPAPLIEAAMAAMAGRPAEVARRAVETLATHGKSLADAAVLVLGVAYKPGVCDIRESPALEIIDRLAAGAARVAYTDHFVPALDTAGGRLHHVAEPHLRRWDLVVAHTLHPDGDLAWLAQQPAVLDATYRLAPAANRSVV